MQIPKDLEVLIVEDEKDICYLLSGILNKQEVRTACAANLFDAQKAIKINHPDIVFIDNQLPDGYGIDFIPLLKRDFPATKIIMMTAQDELEVENKAYQLGADYFIGKPFTQATVVNTLKCVLFTNPQ